MNSMQIQCFLKAAQMLSFTESAAEMFISQPAFSHNISTLEEEWGISLFDRNNKRKNTLLTPAGAIMYDGMKNLHSQFKDLLQKAQSVHQGKSGILRIGLIGSDRIDEKTLVLFDRFQEKQPSVDLLLRRGSHSELVQWLYNKTIDLSISLKIDVMDKEWLDYQTLYSIESVLILNASHPLAQREGLSLADFQGETFVNVSARESPVLNAMLKQECEKAGFTPGVVDAPDINAQTLYLESGKGVAVGSVNNTAAFNPRMTMVRLRDLQPLELAVVWNRKNDNPCIPLFRSIYELIE
ncbi:MAG: LysR family transcriptional regulator [Clostridiales bacterium]|nr:LysR family transcriptional regulator [Clostridiales bacterium]